MKGLCVKNEDDELWHKSFTMTDEAGFFLGQNFITRIIENDIRAQPCLKIVTRFPPEPNGYLHIGHAKSILLNFGLADYYGGQCYLRFDDTNPEKESDQFVQAIQEDVQWLGCRWSGAVRFASSYFEKMYEAACALIAANLAYVDEQDPETIRLTRGTLQTAGIESPYRQRCADENQALFTQMRAGVFQEGQMVLRAKIDMASPNLNLRDPVIYRIRHVKHHRTDKAWCIYPMYTFAHPLEDAIEGITHSLCTLEFEDQRPFYDWLLQNLVSLGVLSQPLPRQYEFSRLTLAYTMTSKRFLSQLVDQRVVEGWDDPSMPTIAGMRRRGYSPSALKRFIARTGLSKSDSVMDMDLLENAVREDLELSAPRLMGVLKPLLVILTNFDDHHTQSRKAAYHPQNPTLGERIVPLSSRIWIDQDDFLENPLVGFQRLTLGAEVRLRYSYVIRCNEVVKDHQGKIEALLCSIDHDTLGKNPADRKVKGVIHWVSQHHAVPAKIRLYKRLLKVAHRDEIDESLDFSTALALATNRVEVAEGFVEPMLASWRAERRCQLERLGYFVTDRFEHRPHQEVVLNRIVTLKDTWRRP